MRGLILAAMCCAIALYKSDAQATTEISIDKRAYVNGAKIKTAQIRIDPQRKSKNGIELTLQTTGEVSSDVESFDWRIRYLDRYGNVIVDTSVRQYCPLDDKEEDQIVQAYSIDPITGETTIKYVLNLAPPPIHQMNEKGQKEKRTYYGYLGLWPTNAVRAKVGLDHVDFGSTTYYAPGRL